MLEHICRGFSGIMLPIRISWITKSTGQKMADSSWKVKAAATLAGIALIIGYKFCGNALVGVGNKSAADKPQDKPKTEVNVKDSSVRQDSTSAAVQKEMDAEKQEAMVAALKDVNDALKAPCGSVNYVQVLDENGNKGSKAVYQSLVIDLMKDTAAYGDNAGALEVFAERAAPVSKKIAEAGEKYIQENDGALPRVEDLLKEPGMQGVAAELAALQVLTLEDVKPVAMSKLEFDEACKKDPGLKAFGVENKDGVRVYATLNELSKNFPGNENGSLDKFNEKLISVMKASEAVNSSDAVYVLKNGTVVAVEGLGRPSAVRAAVKADKKLVV